MRLLQYDPSRYEVSLTPDLTHDLPAYAILSHTWGKDTDEATFQDIIHKRGKDKPGYQKIVFCGIQARADNLDYFWVDTCCIDKTSSAELNESINSMFKWYQNAQRCYVYLADVSRNTMYQSDISVKGWKAAFRGSKWFTRGWTLQELLAPRDVRFYDVSWSFCGTKSDLVDVLSEITHIHPSYFAGTGALLDSLRLTHAVVKLSWASHRTTTRVEDMAYCLLGLFDVHMPLLYGEGSKAFRRLQEEILVKDGDISVLAWKPEHPISGTTGVLAKSPSEFLWLRDFNMDFSVFVNRKECSFTSRGLRLNNQLLRHPISDSNEPDQPPYFRFLLDLDCWAWGMEKNPKEPIWLKWPSPVPGRQDVSFGIYLRKYGESSYCRDFMDTSDSMIIIDPKNLPQMCPAETLSMYIHRNSLPESYWTRFPFDPYGNDSDEEIQQIGVHFPKLPGLEIIDVGNQGLWDASNRMILCTYYQLETIVTMQLKEPISSSILKASIILKPLHLYHRVQVSLLKTTNPREQHLLKDLAEFNGEDDNSAKLGSSISTNEIQRSEKKKWSINCSTSLKLMSNISFRFKVLCVDLSLSPAVSEVSSYKDDLDANC